MNKQPYLEELIWPYGKVLYRVGWWDEDLGIRVYQDYESDVFARMKYDEELLKGIKPKTRKLLP